MAPTVTPDFDAWVPWHPREVAERLAGVDVPWCVAAGWALDLFVSEHSGHVGLRPHEDLEIAIPESRFGEIIGRFADCDFYVVGDRAATPYPEGSARHHQTWALDRADQVWRLDVFREPAEGDVWICRRDERIRLPYRQLIWRTTDGIPCLAPEVVLLLKAKWTRPKDEADLAGGLPLLSHDQREWLAWALDIAHPGHPWLTCL